MSAQQMFRHNWTVCLFKLCLESVKQAWTNLCYCVALWLLCWLWTGFHWAGVLTQKNQLVGKYLPEFSVAILNRPLSSYYSTVSSLTHVFTGQSGQIKKSLYYTHGDHFMKHHLLNFSNALFHNKESVWAEICQFT